MNFKNTQGNNSKHTLLFNTEIFLFNFSHFFLVLLFLLNQLALPMKLNCKNIVKLVFYSMRNSMRTQKAQLFILKGP